MEKMPIRLIRKIMGIVVLFPYLCKPFVNQPLGSVGGRLICFFRPRPAVSFLRKKSGCEYKKSGVVFRQVFVII
jgi:hypothetical protein